MIRLFLLVITLLFVPISYAAVTFKCNNGDGMIYFTDKRCEDNDQKTMLNPKTAKALPQKSAGNFAVRHYQPEPSVQYLPIPE